MTGAGIGTWLSGGRRAFRAIMLANALLLLLLAVLWLWPGMSTWSPPPANTASFSDVGGLLPGMTPVTPEALRATVERPLFSEGRQPPDVGNTAGADDEGAGESPVANIRLLGFFSGGDVGGIIADVDGEVKRVALGQSFGQWTVQRIDTDARQVVLRNGAEEEVLHLPLSSAEDMAKAGAAAKPPPANTRQPPAAARRPVNTRQPAASTRSGG